MMMMMISQSCIHKYENLKSKLYNCSTNIYLIKLCMTALYIYFTLYFSIFNTNGDILPENYIQEHI